MIISNDIHSKQRSQFHTFEKDSERGSMNVHKTWHNNHSYSDRVDISEESRKLASANATSNNDSLNSTAKSSDTDEDSDLIKKVITSVATKDGGSIVVEKRSGSSDPDGNGLKMVVYDKNGEVQSESALDKDTIIKQGENGTLTIGAYSPGSETSGDDIIFAVSGNQVNGGSGDDIIVDLTGEVESSKSFTENFNPKKKKEIFDISGGEGNDRIILAGDNIRRRVDSGAGNDTVEALGNLDSSSYIETGAGDDKLNLLEANGVVLDLGEGDDEVKSMRGTFSADIDTGAGNDEVDVNNFSGTLKMGDGEDKLNVKYDVKADIDTGRGDDSLNVGGKLGSGDATYGHSITTGQGNDFISAGNINGGTIIAGQGDDEIHASMSGGDLFTGSGNDYIQSAEIKGGSLFTGSGNDNVLVTGKFAGKYMSTGIGDDIVQAGELSSGNVVTGAGEDIIKSYGDISSTLETGEGMDKVYADGVVDTDKIMTGEGNDIFDVGGFVSSKNRAQENEVSEEERKRKEQTLFKTSYSENGDYNLTRSWDISPRSRYI